MSAVVEGLKPHPFAPMDWAVDAACQGADTSVFFVGPGGYGSEQQAKKICEGCTVKAACLDFAIANREVHGIWGGLGTKARRNEAKRRRDLAYVQQAEAEWQEGRRAANG